MAFRLIVGVAAVAALATSLAAYRTSRRALSVRASGLGGFPAVQVQATEGQAKRVVADDIREYALRVSLSNATPAAVSVASLVLRVTYRTRANFLGAVDLAPLPELPPAASGRA